MKLNNFLILYQNDIFNRKVVFYLKVKFDRGFGYSCFDKIDKKLYPYFEVESFEIPTVSEGIFTANQNSSIELHINIKIKKQYHDYIYNLIMRSKAHEITL